MPHSTLLLLIRIMLVLLCTGIPRLFAQHTGIRCGNDNAGQLQVIATAEQRISAYRQMASRPTGLDPVIIPVVVHILFTNESENIPDEKILAQLDLLNQAYNGKPQLAAIPEEFRALTADMDLKFCLAGTDPQGQPTDGIVRKAFSTAHPGFDSAIYYTLRGGSDAWDPTRYLNIWVTNLGDQLLGFSSYPWTDNRATDGIVINTRYFGPNEKSKRYNQGKTLVHETGHYLGLFHLWDNGGCATDNDQVDDTPPQAYSYLGMPAYPQYSCATSNMFMNYLDYTDDAGLLFFTQGQQKRVKACLSAYRPGLGTDVVTCAQRTATPGLDFTLYPNPASGGIVHIAYPYGDYTALEIRVYDITGRQLDLTTLRTPDRHQLDLSGLSSGLYLVRIGDVSRKLIKK